jgi:hypothetical protein
MIACESRSCKHWKFDIPFNCEGGENTNPEGRRINPVLLDGKCPCFELKSIIDKESGKEVFL